MRRVFGILIGLALLAGCQRADRLNGGGSSFVYPVMLKWSRVYAAETGIQIDYQSAGSGNGIQQMTVGTIDFGCTDAPMTTEQRDKAKSTSGEVVHIPLVMGGVVPVYNLPDLPKDKRLRFSGPVLAGIFLGTIQKWNHPDLQALNPDIPMPDEKILVISRSDPSGTTAIFADYISKIEKKLWDDKEMGKPGTSTRWPAGEAQKGNEGVSGLVRRVPGSMGYVELKYALDVGLDYGEVRNQAGQFVLATPDTVQAAAAAALKTIPKDLCFSLTNAPGNESYPIAGMVWAVFYRQMEATHVKDLTNFLRWATDPERGQKYGVKLGYAPLPTQLVEAVRIELNSVSPMRSTP
jgi:phosphate transport system substrate-binding protein